MLIYGLLVGTPCIAPSIQGVVSEAPVFPPATQVVVSDTPFYPANICPYMAYLEELPVLCHHVGRGFVKPLPFLVPKGVIENRATNIFIAHGNLRRTGSFSGRILVSHRSLILVSLNVVTLTFVIMHVATIVIRHESRCTRVR